MSNPTDKPLTLKELRHRVFGVLSEYYRIAAQAERQKT
jgi:hypothetical protein